ncbi:uncharacterized protein G2W53_039199 [Senna tora]|uniref:Uncharacterized protein n=1 Tax=Senna tora TaxID=362788 RepID=A0A834SMC5_9FABA|nr:uncharacterized protein G2W53_039199 [Senna tora]
MRHFFHHVPFHHIGPNRLFPFSINFTSLGTSSRLKDKGQLTIWAPRKTTKQVSTINYIVELPEEGDTLENESVTGSGNYDNGEEELAVRLAKRLALKRQRTTNEEDETDDETKVEKRSKGGGRCKYGWGGGPYLAPPGAMSTLLCWNCRGIGVASTVRALKDLVSWGLCLMWTKEVDVTVIDTCLNFIHVKVLEKKDGLCWWFTGVYGHPDFQARRFLWDKISILRRDSSAPWCCAGDFNELLSHSEKCGIRKHSNYQIEIFRSFVDRNRLVEGSMKGYFFTWCNNRPEGCVKEKLDRFFINSRWMNVFPNSEFVALPAVGSDHSPLIARLFPKFWIVKRQFRFEEYWAEDDECKDVVNRSWNTTNDSRGWEKFMGSKKAATESLTDWSKRKFKRADLQIKKLKAEVQHLQNSRSDAAGVEKMAKCKEKIDVLWKQEEAYWHARAKVKWLQCGDKNSRFFHLTTIKRRANNRISRIKDANGVWKEDREGIREVLQSYYESLFQSSAPRGIEDVLAVNILNDFSHASGQRINLAKSGLLFNRGVNRHLKEELATLLGFPVWDAPARYLGKEVMIKSVVQAIPSYIMSIVKMPKSFCEKLSAMVARFWWSQGKKEKGIHWIKWAEMTRSKWKGGWGFKDFHCQNIALLAKQAWRLAQSGDQLWAQVMKSIYFPRSSFWDAKKGRNGSWPWISILEGRDFIRKHCAWCVGNGSSIKVINECWIPGERRIWHVEDGDREMKVCDLLADGELKWDEQKIARCLPKDVGRKVLAVPLNVLAGEDKIVWPCTKDGTYSVSTGYHLLAEEFSNAMAPSSSINPIADFWKVIWGARVQPKIRSFIWKACKNAIPTKANLCKRRMAIEAECPLCNREAETVEHLFLKCDWVRAVWFGSPFQWVLDGGSSESFAIWLEERIKLLNDSPVSHHDAIPTLFCLLWAIWRGRNAKVFEGERLDPTLTLSRAKNDCRSYIEAVFEEKNDRKESGSVAKWKPPPQDVFKLNVDAATELRWSRGAIAVVVRDNLGNLVTGSAKRIPCLSALQAETMAFKEALAFAKTLDMKKIIIESDCQQVVCSFNTCSFPWQLSSLFKECQTLIGGFDHVEVRWINRCANGVADCVAKLALSHMLPLSWSWNPPVKLRSYLLADKCGWNAS